MKRTTRSGPAGALLGGELPSDVEWTAITGCDASADGAFWYAVRSTGIFAGRPAAPAIRGATARSCSGRRSRRWPPASDPASAASRKGRQARRGLAVRDGGTDRRAAARRTVPRRAGGRRLPVALASASPLQAGDGLDAAAVHPPRADRAGQAAAGRYGADRGAVAKECGIPSASRFIALFRQEAGCTPAEYRRRTGGDQDVEGGKAE